MDPYVVVITFIGLAALGMAWLPQGLKNVALSYPILYLLLGMLLYSLPINLPSPDPLQHKGLVLHITEIAVIITLMGTGIKIDRAFGWKNWKVPILLATVTMVICITSLAFLGWWLLGLTPAAAVLLGAVLAPTDPVLASDVQVGPPREGSEDHVRFSLTAEAGLNDGMAFPFTWLAIALALQGSNDFSWFGEWVWQDVLYRITAGVLVGYLMGKLIAYLVFQLPKKTSFPEAKDGFVALSTTLLVYGITEMIHGYGFMAVFFAGLTIGSQERGHHFHRELHDFTDQIERILLVLLLIPLGGSLVQGVLLDYLTWKSILVSFLFLFIIRPLAALPAFIGTHMLLKEKLAIGFFGIRGIGSFFYLAFALYQTNLANAQELWAIVGFIVLTSIVMHGITATPVMKRLDMTRVKRKREINNSLRTKEDEGAGQPHLKKK
jgi:sodium/hydrogen antiporter